MVTAFASSPFPITGTETHPIAPKPAGDGDGGGRGSGGGGSEARGGEEVGSGDLQCQEQASVSITCTYAMQEHSLNLLRRELTR